MYKNMSVVLFIMAFIFAIYLETHYEWTYSFPSKVAIKAYAYLFQPSLIALLLDIIKRIFKNKKVSRIILVLNVLLLIGTVIYFILIDMVVSAFSNATEIAS